MHPALRYWRDDVSSLLLHTLAYGGGIAAAALFAAFVAIPPKAAAVSEPAPQTQIQVKDQWVEIERPFPAFSLSIPESGGAVSHYELRRHAAGGGRKDILTLGDAAGTTPYLRVEIYRPGSEIESFADPAAAMTAQAAHLGRVEQISTEPDLDSKFGLFSIAHLSVAGDPPRRCVGFARSYGEPRLQMAGLFCQSPGLTSAAGGGEFIARTTLTCALDRLTLNAAGGDLKTGALFAQAELRRNFCGQRNSLMAPTPKYPVLWKAYEQRQKAAAR